MVVKAIESNDTLARLVRHTGPLQWVMWECECGACRDLVTLQLAAFDELRARGDRVLLAAHAAAGSRAA